VWPAFFSRRWKYRGCFQLAKDGRNVQSSRMRGGVGVILHSPNRCLLIYSWRLNFNFSICSVIDIGNIEFEYLNQKSWINTRDNDIQLFSDLCSLRGFGCSISAEEDLLLIVYVSSCEVRLSLCVSFICTWRITYVWLCTQLWSLIHTRLSRVILTVLRRNADRILPDFPVYPCVCFGSALPTCDCQERTISFILVLYC
jgi:hypothetical protein